MNVVFYISGHGFGHASRTVEVINALIQQRSDVRVHVRTAAARWFFDLTLSGAFEFSARELDVGVVQVDALTPDIEATLDRAARFYADTETIIEEEACALRDAGAKLVVADTPPLAFAAAERAGVAAIALSNFTWDWIYEDYARVCGRDLGLVGQIRQWQRTSREAWRLPMHGGFEGFEHIRDLPLVARRSYRPRHETRRTLGWDDDRLVLLASFGGVPQHLPLERAAQIDELLIVTTQRPDAVRFPDHPLLTTESGVQILDEHKLYEMGLRYEDVVAAADVVVTKPGYGIVAECIANQTPLLYTSRGRFAEYDVLVGAMPGWLRCRYIDRVDLMSGHWAPHVHALLAQPVPDDRPAVNGAEVAAEWICDLLDR